MKHLLAIILFVVFAGCSWSSWAQTEDSEALEMQDESGRPLSGVGWLSRIDIKRKLIGIDDFQFILTDSSKFLTEDSRPATANLFQLETLVRFEANGKGEILSLWRYIDTENEYSLKNPPERTNGKSDNLSTGKNVNKEKLVKEKGVWKN